MGWPSLEKSRDKERHHFVRAFEKCGISLPIDGSFDERINVRGLEGYWVGESVDDEIEEEDWDDDILFDELAI